MIHSEATDPLPPPPEPPPVTGFTNTPEFQEAVAAALAKMMETASAEKDNATDAKSLMQALAMEISQLTDQGTGRKRVAPEVLRMRQAGLERMMRLLKEARTSKTVVSWRVKSKCYLADRVVEPFWIATDHTAQPTEIDWDGVPNEAMMPLNKPAEAIHDAFRQWIGSSARVVPDDALAITPGGLVVHGGAAGLSSGKRKVDPEARHTGEPEPEGALNIHHKNKQGYVETRILGSIAEPARQTA
jgi:hypothetical protein